MTALPTVPSPPPGNCTVDLIFVLDASGSIDSAGFDQMKLLVSRIVNNLDIEDDNARVGLLTYSTAVDARFNLSTYKTRAEVQAAIAELTFTAGLTNTADALAHVRQVMLLPAAGARDDAANVVVVMTDAGSNDKRATQVSFVNYARSCFLPFCGASYARSFVMKNKSAVKHANLYSCDFPLTNIVIIALVMVALCNRETIYIFIL